MDLHVVESLEGRNRKRPDEMRRAGCVDRLHVDHGAAKLGDPVGVFVSAPVPWAAPFEHRVGQQRRRSAGTIDEVGRYPAAGDVITVLVQPRRARMTIGAPSEKACPAWEKPEDPRDLAADNGLLLHLPTGRDRNEPLPPFDRTRSKDRSVLRHPERPAGVRCQHVLDGARGEGDPLEAVPRLVLRANQAATIAPGAPGAPAGLVCPWRHERNAEAPPTAVTQFGATR